MFDQIFKRINTIKKHTNAPLLKQRLTYLQHWNGRNASPKILKDAAQYLLRVIEFLNLETNTAVITTEEIEEAANEWAQYQFKKRATFSKTAKNHFIWHATHWLEMLDRLKHSPEIIVPFFHKIFKRSHIIKKHTNAPLLEERLQYLQYWENNGASPGTLRTLSRYLLLIITYMKFYQVREIGLDEIEEAADRCLHHRPHSSTNTCLKSAKSRFVQNALGWLKSLECLRLPEKITLPFEEQLNQYTAYMDYEQGLAETTIEGRVRILQNFLKEVANTCESLGEITPLTIDKIIIKKHDIDKYSRLSIRNYATVVRSFVKYHGNIGQCQLRLADTIKAPRVYKFESLPLSPSWDDIKVLLQSTEGDHPTSIRDRAILMLLSIYGLRCCEVAKLRLENIDWRHEFLHLKRAKRSRPQTFPLSLSVGNALLRYIKEIRPTRCSLEEVFLCRRAPYRPLSNYSIYQIVNRRLKPLQLEIKHHGPHALRHACASHLINEGVSLKEISDQLGHQGLETTRIYTKVDLSSLRQIADFDIGDVL